MFNLFSEIRIYFLRTKYISTVIKSPERRRKFKILPTPKYLRIKNRVKPKEIRKPCLELANTVEKAKRRPRNIKRKNPGRANVVSGSTK
mgnify:CR=1 FL=1